MPPLVCVAEALVVFNTSLRVGDLGGDELIIGIAAAFQSVMALIFSIVAGKISDKVGRERIYHWGLIIFTLSILGLGLSPNYYVLIISLGLNGMGAALFWPIIVAFLADISHPDKLARHLLALNITWSGGAFIGYVLAGFARELSSRYGGGSPFYFCFVLGLFALFYSYAFVHMRGTKKREVPLKIEPITRKQLSSVRMGFLIMACVVFNCAIVVWFLPKYASDIGISAGTAGIIIAMAPLAELFTYVALRAFKPDVNASYYTVPFIVLNAASFAVFLASGENALVLGAAMCIMGVSTGGCYSFSQYHTVLHPHARGAKSGILHTVCVAGALGGSFFGGLAVRLTGSNRAPFVLALTVAGFLIIALFFTRYFLGVTERALERN